MYPDLLTHKLVTKCMRTDTQTDQHAHLIHQTDEAGFMQFLHSAPLPFTRVAEHTRVWERIFQEAVVTVMRFHARGPGAHRQALLLDD